tara:strand:+ start:2176 stop:2340 length:165 start_codon:yes stop_codon:yes gene_type:complete
MKKSEKFFWKKGIVSEYLPWLILAIVILAVVMLIIFNLNKQGTSLIDQIKNLFR